MPNIHSTALVDPKATLAESVSVGPYSIVGPDVVLGEGVEVMAHAVIDGRTTIGAGVRIFPFASVGLPPQDLKYKGEPSTLEIGEGCVIREHATVNPGTEGGGMVTRVGRNVLLAIGSHVAHDCLIGDQCVIMNNVLLGGHVEIGDFAVIGGGSAIHQFARIGKHSMIGGASGVEGDVIPYGTAMGNRARLAGLNIVGIKRRGFSREDIHALRNAYKALFAGVQGTVMADRLREVAAAYADSQPVQEIVAFLEAGGSRAICQPDAQPDVQAVAGDAG
jgi:UDP-N-acetylglucosamine acyltransferase